MTSTNTEEQTMQTKKAKRTYTRRVQMPSGPIIWVDRNLAEMEGIDVERMTEHYAKRNIRIITEEAYFIEEEGRWVCPGCKIAWERDADVWRPNTLPGGSEWQGICRRCEQTELEDAKQRSQHRLAHRRRMRERAAIGDGAGASDAKRKPHRPAGQGHRPRMPRKLA